MAPEWISGITRRRFLLALIASALARGVHAADPADVLLLLSDRSGPYLSLARSVRTTLHERSAGGTRVETRTLDTPGALPSPRQVLVAVGSNAMDAALGAPREAPVLCTLIPSAAFEARMAPSGPPADVSAVFLDQPVARQLDLIRVMLPGARDVGVILGPAWRGRAAALERLAAQRDLALHTTAMTPGDNPVAVVEALLGSSDVLLALPDPAVFNRRTIQPLLLTTYRHRVPVIGFSQAYVRAGALAGVHSTPIQLGRQVAEWIAGLAAAAGAGALPPPSHPDYYDVGVNRQVARSLGLRLPGEREIARRLRELERSAP